jgi:uncharacterized protein (TIGR02266 family)
VSAAASALPLCRVRLKYPDVETLVERFSANVTRGGIFLASREPRPVDTAIRFEVSLLGGAVVLSGEGKVTWVKAFDPAAPARPHGMGVSFTRLDPGCRDMWKRLIDRREARAGRNGAEPVRPARLPTPGSRDAVAAELEAIDDTALRRASDRARSLAARIANVEDLLVRDPPESVPEMREALAELPRYLQTRRGTGANRVGDPRPDRPDPDDGAKPDDNG